jgi:hypothetical protein
VSTAKQPVSPALTVLRVKALHARIDKAAHHYADKARSAAKLAEPADIKRMRKAVQAFDKKARAAVDKASRAARARTDRLRYDVLFATDSAKTLAAVEAFEREASRA